VYGPVITRGLSPGRATAQYWGQRHHSRLGIRAIRGLPKLKGRKPFGGFVLSHDFVEAALMRRGGWKVRMATIAAALGRISPRHSSTSLFATPLGSGKSAAHENHRRGGPEVHFAHAPGRGHNELFVLAPVAVMIGIVLCTCHSVAPDTS